MNEIDPSKYVNIINKNNKKNTSNKFHKYLTNLIIRTLIVVIIFLSLSIIYKTNNSLKDKISSYFFYDDISFTEINKLYDKYLGGLLPVKNESDNTNLVFDEKLAYIESSIYYDGVCLSVSDSYLVPALDEGMVVFIGDKENYGKTVIIENLDGVQYWYGNIVNTSLKLYDYIEKGSLVGDVNNYLYMVFSKDGNYLNYDEYIF